MVDDWEFYCEKCHCSIYCCDDDCECECHGEDEEQPTYNQLRYEI